MFFNKTVKNTICLHPQIGHIFLPHCSLSSPLPGSAHSLSENSSLIGARSSSTYTSLHWPSSLLKNSGYCTSQTPGICFRVRVVRPEVFLYALLDKLICKSKHSACKQIRLLYAGPVVMIFTQVVNVHVPWPDRIFKTACDWCISHLVEESRSEKHSRLAK